jgi:hypothetical protein
MKATAYCRDYEEYPEIFPENYGNGITFRDGEGVEYTTVVTERQRIVYANICSFGCSREFHQYGKIYVREPYLRYSEAGIEKTMTRVGAIDRYKPVECRGIQIELVRPVTEADIQQERWKNYYDAGDQTNAFCSREELLKVIKLVFEERFQGQWKLVIEK